MLYIRLIDLDSDELTQHDTQTYLFLTVMLGTAKSWR